MKNKNGITRRGFIQLGASFGMLAGLGGLKLAKAQGVPDYKALVCLFMFGGNDGHNLIVPQTQAQYTAYANARPGLALSGPSQLLPINDPVQGNFALHYGIPELQTLYIQGKMAVLANVGMLVKQTSFAEFQAGIQLPTQLRSHSDQVNQMQTGVPDTGGNSGWGGRTIDIMAPSNTNAAFPVSIAMNQPALFCTGVTTPGTSLQAGNYLDQNAFNIWGATGVRKTAEQQIIAQNGGNQMVAAANKVMSDALTLNPLLQAAAGSNSLITQFPGTNLGNQLKEVARYIGLHSQLNVGRQVFFVNIGGFDTHSGQSYQQYDLLQQVSKAVSAFYYATVEMGISDKVTTFTLSDFGRTLQPSGTGSDHGWGSHHLIVGGAVNGGKVYGKFPTMTAYPTIGQIGSTQQDFADNRGVLLPNISLSQYGATLAQWFGATDPQLDGLFPTLTNFTTRNLGFMY